jgi:hypothetical protein
VCFIVLLLLRYGDNSFSRSVIPTNHLKRIIAAALTCEVTTH